METKENDTIVAPPVRTSFPTDNQGKIDLAVTLKNKGNDLFKEGKFKKAIVEYSKALSFTKGLPGRKEGLEGLSQMAMSESYSVEDLITPEQNNFINELDVIIKTNISTCYIKLNNSIKALEIIREALLINPKAWKSLLRKAEAIMLINDTDKALIILEDALKYAPDENACIAINKMKEKVLKTIKTEEAKQRKAFSNIFEKARQQTENL